ncbi:hypothetical protein NDU88_000896 [Pleurodeles waltl]|uniref:Uncharacterized protein n=1 Tax=Pleurodeles waltl TaxID=8319 RepID=A0AAV7VAB3_PLEWA|nr:hypothetical protein NDU88_000896 [Pleurodeles waltl]
MRVQGARARELRTQAPRGKCFNRPLHKMGSARHSACLDAETSGGRFEEPSSEHIRSLKHKGNRVVDKRVADMLIIAQQRKMLCAESHQLAVSADNAFK